MDNISDLRKTVEYHESFWKVQRVAWAGILLIILAALAGLFSKGPVARAEAASDDGLRVRYSRFGRMSAVTTVQITVDPRNDQNGALIWIWRPYLNRFQVTGILPEPRSATAVGDEIRYSFAAEASKPLHVTFRLSAEEGTFGRITSRIRTSRATVEYWQFFWP